MVGDGVIMCQQLHKVSAPYGIVHFELVISIGNVGSFLSGKTKTYQTDSYLPVSGAVPSCMGPRIWGTLPGISSLRRPLDLKQLKRALDALTRTWWGIGGSGGD